MKSSQTGNILRTSCKNCVLAIYKGKTQVGCHADRIEKFENIIEAYDEEKEFYVVERLCNYYRDDAEKYIEYSQPDLSKIRFESQASFDIILLCDGIDKEYQTKIIDLYLSTTSKYDEKKIKIHLCYNKIDSKQLDVIKSVRSYIGTPLMSFYKNDIFIHNLFMRSSNSYSIVITKDAFPSNDFIVNINDLVNEKMKRVLVAMNGNVCAFSNLAYKINTLKNTENRNYKSIVNNIIDESKEKGFYYTA